MPYAPLLRTAIRSADCSIIYILYLYLKVSICVCAQSGGVENHLRTPISRQRVLDAHRKRKPKRTRIVYRHSTLFGFIYVHTLSVCVLWQHQDNTGTGIIGATHNCITFLVGEVESSRYLQSAEQRGSRELLILTFQGVLFTLKPKIT